MTDDEVPEALRKIACALAVPMISFFDRCEAREGGSAEQAARESSELLEAFAQITDAQIRQECIEFVRSKNVSSVKA